MDFHIPKIKGQIWNFQIVSVHFNSYIALIALFFRILAQYNTVSGLQTEKILRSERLQSSKCIQLHHSSKIYFYDAKHIPGKYFQLNLTFEVIFLTEEYQQKCHHLPVKKENLYIFKNQYTTKKKSSYLNNIPT